jgi:hypothetical protein
MNDALLFQTGNKSNFNENVTFTFPVWRLEINTEDPKVWNLLHAFVSMHDSGSR